MLFSKFGAKGYGLTLVLSLLMMFAFGFGRNGAAANAFHINGYYLGATPKDLGVKVVGDADQEEKYFESETNGVHLFFVMVQDRLRVYRIIKEESGNEENIKAILDSLKGKYGPPDRQQIKTSSTRPKFQMEYVTTVKNRAIWNISTTQEFIVEIESKRITYELIDHNPENSKPAKSPGDFEDSGFGFEKWDPDY